jgi:nucleoside-diphosphate-sugar epimerase
LLAGAAGQLGQALVVALHNAGHQVTAIDANVAPLNSYSGLLTYMEQVDLQDPESLPRLCDGMDVVITTVGIGRPQRLTDYERVDYGGNLNLLRAARKTGVRRFVYTSIHKVESDASIPMLRAKSQME